jgi:hypothetical protein
MAVDTTSAMSATRGCVVRDLGISAASVTNGPRGTRTKVPVARDDAPVPRGNGPVA